MRRTAARLAGLLAAGGLLLAAAPAVATAAPDAAPRPSATPSAATTGKIAQLHVDGDRLEVLFSALGLPSGRSIDPSSVQLFVDGESVQATARPVAAASPPAVVQRRAMLVLDVSGSMAGPGLAGAKRAASAFLAAVPADVKVGLVVVSTTASVAAQPTTDRGRLRSLIAGLSAHGDTALYDGTVLALGALGGSGSRTVVLLTDGVDEGSHASLSAAVDAARGSGAVIDAVSLGVTGAQVAPLKQLVGATDGRILATTDAADLAEGFAQAARDIATQVLVSATLPASVLSGGNDLSVTVTASAAGTRLTDAAYLPLPAPPTPPTTGGGHGPKPAAIDVPWAARGPVLWIALAMLLLGLAPLIAFAIRRAGTREYPQTRVRRRLSFYTLGAARGAVSGDDTDDAGTPPAWADLTDHGHEPGDAGPLRSALVAAARVTVRGDRERQLGRRLDAAGVPLKPAEWTVVQVATPLALALLFLLLSAANPVAVILGLIIGALAPAAYLSVKQSRRTAAFLTQLPETLQLIAGSLSVGHSLPQALDTVVRESTAPMSTEFNRALIENRLGVPLEEALDGVAGRMGSQDFRWVVMAIRIQREVGGNLSEILATVAATLRERDRLRRQVRVLSAEGRLSAWILGAMPPVFAAYLLMTRPGYVRPLFHDSLGIAMLLIAVGLMIVGVFWLRKVVKVEV